MKRFLVKKSGKSPRKKRSVPSAPQYSESRDDTNASIDPAIEIMDLSDDTDKDKTYVPVQTDNSEVSDSESENVETIVSAGDSRSQQPSTSSKAGSTSSDQQNSSDPKPAKITLSSYFEYSTTSENGREIKTGRCKICLTQRKKTTVLRMTGRNTSGLKRHLRSFHESEYFEVYPSESSDRQQPSIIDLLTKSATGCFRKDVDKTGNFDQNKFEEMAADWIAVKYLPLHFFDDKRTQELFAYLRPEVKLPKRNTLRVKVIKRFNQLKTAVMSILQKNPSKLSFTIDAWTSVANKSFYGITVHYIDSNWKLQSIVLDFVPSRGHHTGEDIARIFYTSLLEYGLDVTRIQGITVDNAAANSTFMVELSKFVNADLFDPEDQHFRCIAHILNLAVQDALNLLKVNGIENPDLEEYFESGENGDESEEEECSTALLKLRRLLTTLRKSEQWMNRYKVCCEMTNVKMISPPMDVSTRWNSTNDMIAAALKVKPALNVLCESNEELARYKLQEDEWNILESVYKFLRNFKKLSEMLGGDKYVTLPSVIVGLNMLLDKIEQTVKALDEKKDRNDVDTALLLAYQSARDKILKHYKKTNWVYCVVLILDPRHKVETFHMSNWGKELLEPAVEKFEKIYKVSYFANERDGQTVSAESGKTGNLSHVTEDDDDLLDFGSLYESRKEAENLHWKEEIDRYLSIDREHKDTDILIWWQQNENKYPILARMAKDFLGTPATSVPAERLFTRGSLTVRKHRNRLNPESARSLLCVNSWVTSELFPDILKEL